MNVCDLTDVEIPHAAGALYSTPKIFCAGSRLHAAR